MGTSGSARDSKDGARVLLDVGSCLALSLFWVWNWTTFQSPTSLPLEFFDGAVTLPTRFVSLMAFAVTGFVLFACFQARPAKPHSLPQRLVYYGAFVALAAGMLAFDVADGAFDGEYTSVNFLFADVFMGVTGAFLYAEFGKLFGSLGAKRYRFVVICCVASVALSVPLSMSLFGRGVLRQVFTAAFMAGAIPLLWFLRRSYALHPAKGGNDSHVPAKFVVTLVLVGASYGLMQSCFAESNSIRMMNPLSAMGFVLAAALAASTILLLKYDFNRLIYQIGFPLLAVGLLFTALGSSTSGHLASFFGVLLSIAGYRFVELLIWVLCVYLTSNIRGSQRWLFVLIGSVLSLSQAMGLLVFETVLSPHTTTVFAATAVILLICALYLVTGKTSYENWGIAKPGDTQPNESLVQACTIIAVDKFFTAREKDIFLLLAQGRNRKAISKKLVLSENTVKTHVSNVYRKLDVHTQQELIDYVEQRIDQ